MPLASCSDCQLSLTSIGHCRGHKLLKCVDSAPSSLRFIRDFRRKWRPFSEKQQLTGVLKARICFPAAERRYWQDDRHKLVPHASGNDNAESGQGQEEEEETIDVDRTQQEAAGPSYTTVKEAFATGSSRYMSNLRLDLKRDTGVDIDVLRRACDAIIASLERRREELAQKLFILQRRFQGYSSRAVAVADIVRLQFWPQFVSWNRWELWKDVKRWDAQRIGALVMYVLVVAASFRGLHTAITKPETTKRLANAYMEAVIPDPTPHNVRKLRKAMWRQKMPKGFRMHRYIYDRNGELHPDQFYIGENAWEDSDDEEFPSDVNKVIDENATLTENQKEAFKGVASATFDMIRRKRSQSAVGKTSWQERLAKWESILKFEKLKDSLKSRHSKYVIPFNWHEIRKNFLAKRMKQTGSKLPRGYFMARRWWKYKPKLPYTYFLSKVENLEVEAAVYSEDTKKLYVRMREGFPAEYTVDTPVDPYLYQLMTGSGVELDIMPGSDWYYYLRALAILAPSLLFIIYVRYFSHRAFELSSEKIIDLLKMNREHLILPEDAAQKAKSEYKDVVVGENVWQVLEEIMMYMRDPMKYHSKGVKLPRGILISGPPGTGKTLLARAIARESGLPFVFASGAEFVESSTGDGAEKIFDIFFTARANAPSFIFIDEIDALVGKGVNDDPERKSTFEQLLAELDGEPEDTDLDRYSLRQAVVLICATNRPDELDDRFLRPGRIDREIHIGLPGERERIGIFGVHSTGRRLAKDVDFRKLVFRTVGYSGADIRNLINEAGIMAVRRGKEEISQQDFVDVLDKQLFEGLGMVLTEEEQRRAEEKVSVDTKRLLAVHEAGHVLLAHLFPCYDWHAFTHLLPGGKEAALTLFYPRQEMLLKGYTTVGYLKMQMVVAHGGRCAERIVFGDDITDGGQDDLARISKIAREIAISQASPRLGLFPMVWKDKFDPPVPPDEVELVPNNWAKPGNRIANMSMELSEMFTREVTRYADETEEEAMRGLSLNRHILDRLVVELLKRTKISGLEIAEIINSMNPVMLPDPMKLPDMNFDITERVAPPNSLGRYEYLDIYQAPLHHC